MGFKEDFTNIFKEEIKKCCENCKFRIGYNYCKLQNGKNVGSPHSHKCKKFKQK
jgi:hypothetical protein